MIHEAVATSLELQNDPFIGVSYTGPKVWVGNITEVTIGAGRIAVNTTGSELTSEQMRCAILATTGLQNSDIGDNLYLSTHTVRSHLKDTFRKLSIARRSQIAPTLLQTGVYRVVASGEELGLSDEEKDVVGLVVRGRMDIEIGTHLGITRYAPHDRLHKIGTRTGFNGREIIGLAAILSGEVPYRTEAATAA